jgi:hypothetical protein
MSFAAYLKTYPAGDDAAGDFVRNIRNDREIPNAETWRQLEAYLSLRGITDRAMVAGKQVWTAYESRATVRARSF